MRPCVILPPEPVIDDNLRLLGRPEQLGVEHFSAQRAVKPLNVSVWLEQPHLSGPC